MAKRICYIILLTMLCGCGSRVVYRDRIQKVEIPVYREPPKIEKPFRPDLPVHNITKKSTMKEVVEGYVNSIELLQRYVKVLEESLEPYTKK